MAASEVTSNSFEKNFFQDIAGTETDSVSGVVEGLLCIGEDKNEGFLE